MNIEALENETKARLASMARPVAPNAGTVEFDTAQEAARYAVGSFGYRYSAALMQIETCGELRPTRSTRLIVKGGAA